MLKALIFALLLVLCVSLVASALLRLVLDARDGLDRWLLAAGFLTFLAVALLLSTLLV